MKEVKFVAYDKRKKEWVDNVVVGANGQQDIVRYSDELNEVINKYYYELGDILGGYYGEIDNSDFYASEYCIVLEDLGIVDNEGNKIIDGSILQDPDELGTIHIIYWEDHEFLMKTLYKDNSQATTDVGGDYIRHLKLVVVGNVNIAIDTLEALCPKNK